MYSPDSTFGVRPYTHRSESYIRVQSTLKLYDQRRYNHHDMNTDADGRLSWGYATNYSNSGTTAIANNNLYDNLQSRRFEGMRNLKEKIDIFNKIDFTIKTRGGKERETTIGKEGLLYEILSSKYTKNLHPDIASTIFTSVAEEAEDGTFLPTPHSRHPFDGQLITEALREKGFSKVQAKQIWDGLLKTEKKWFKTPLTPRTSPTESLRSL